MGFRADSTVVFIMQVLARNTPTIPNCIPRTSLTHRVAHLAFDADDEPPLPPRPEPLPRQPKPNQVGPRRVFSTWAEYEAALAEYTRQRDDPARVDAARLYMRAQDRRRQQRKRRERPEPASRVGLPENIMFAIEPNGDGEFRTANVVFAEALTL